MSSYQLSVTEFLQVADPEGSGQLQLKSLRYHPGSICSLCGHKNIAYLFIFESSSGKAKIVGSECTRKLLNENKVTHYHSRLASLVRQMKNEEKKAKKRIEREAAAISWRDTPEAQRQRDMVNEWIEKSQPSYFTRSLLDQLQYRSLSDKQLTVVEKALRQLRPEIAKKKEIIRKAQLLILQQLAEVANKNQIYFIRSLIKQVEYKNFLLTTKQAEAMMKIEARYAQVILDKYYPKSSWQPEWLEHTMAMTPPQVLYYIRSKIHGVA